MMSFYHSISSKKRWGGIEEDYTDIHTWFDESKKMMGDIRHRALRHHTEGIFQCENYFGRTITNSEGKVVPVRLIGEQHILEDLGWIPTIKDWFKHIENQSWMNRTGTHPKLKNPNLYKDEEGK